MIDQKPEQKVLEAFGIDIWTEHSIFGGTKVRVLRRGSGKLAEGYYIPKRRGVTKGKALRKVYVKVMKGLGYDSHTALDMIEFTKV